MTWKNVNSILRKLLPMSLNTTEKYILKKWTQSNCKHSLALWCRIKTANIYKRNNVLHKQPLVECTCCFAFKLSVTESSRQVLHYWMHTKNSCSSLVSGKVEMEIQEKLSTKSIIFWSFWLNDRDFFPFSFHFLPWTRIQWISWINWPFWIIPIFAKTLNIFLTNHM